MRSRNLSNGSKRKLYEWFSFLFDPEKRAPLRQADGLVIILRDRDPAGLGGHGGGLLPVCQGLAHALGERLLVEEGEEASVDSILDDLAHRLRVRGHDPAFERH